MSKYDDIYKDAIGSIKPKKKIAINPDDVYSDAIKTVKTTKFVSTAPIEEDNRPLLTKIKSDISSAISKPTFMKAVDFVDKFVSSAWAGIWEGALHPAAYNEPFSPGQVKGLQNIVEAKIKNKTPEEIQQTKDDHVREATSKLLNEVWSGKTSGLTGTLRSAIYNETDGKIDIAWGVDKDKILYTKPGELFPDYALVSKDKQADWLKQNPGIVIEKVIPVKANWLAKSTMYGLAAAAEIWDPIGNATFSKLGTLTSKMGKVPLSFVGKNVAKTAAYDAFIKSTPYLKMSDSVQGAIKWIENRSGAALSKMAIAESALWSEGYRKSRAFTANTDMATKLQIELLHGERVSKQAQSIMKIVDNVYDLKTPAKNAMQGRNHLTKLFIDNGIVTNQDDADFFIDLIHTLSQQPIEKRVEFLRVTGLSLDPEVLANKTGDQLLTDINKIHGELVADDTIKQGNEMFINQLKATQAEFRKIALDNGIDPDKMYNHIVNQKRLLDASQAAPEDYAEFMELVHKEAKEIPKMNTIHPMLSLIPDLNMFTDDIRNKINVLLHKADEIHPYNDWRGVDLRNQIYSVASLEQPRALLKESIGKADSFEDIQKIIGKQQITGALIHNSVFLNDIVAGLKTIEPAYGEALSQAIINNPDILISPSAFKRVMKEVAGEHTNIQLNRTYLADVNSRIGNLADADTNAIYKIIAENQQLDSLQLQRIVKEKIASIDNAAKRKQLRDIFITDALVSQKTLKAEINKYYRDMVGATENQIKDIFDMGIGKSGQLTFEEIGKAWNMATSGNDIWTTTLTTQAGALADPKLVAKNKTLQAAIESYAKMNNIDLDNVERLKNFFANQQQINATAQMSLNKIPASDFILRDGVHIPRTYAVLNLDKGRRIQALEKLQMELKDKANFFRSNDDPKQAAKYDSYADEVGKLNVLGSENDISISSGIVTHGVSGMQIYKHLTERSHISAELAGMLGVVDNIMIAGIGNAARYGAMTNTARGLLYTALDNIVIDGNRLVKTVEELAQMPAKERGYILLKDRFGVLNNKYIPEFMYRHIENLSNTTEPHVFWRALQKATGWMKTAVLATSPYILRNTGSNSVSMILATGENGAKVAAEQAKAWLDLTRAAANPMNVADDIREYATYSAAMLRSISSATDIFTDEVLELPFSISKWDAIKETFRHLNSRSLGSVVNHQEQSAKLAVFRILRDKGVSPAEAVATAEKWLIDYSDVSPLVGSMRRTFFPFITYPSKMAPILAKDIVDNPGRILEMYGKIYRAQNAITNRELLTREMQNAPDRVAGFGKFMFKLPDGQMFDLAYFIPHNIFNPQFDASEPGAVQAVNIFKQYINPVITKAVEIGMNRNSMGQKIFEKGDNALELAWSTGKELQSIFVPQFISRQLLPTLDVMLGNAPASMKDQEVYSRWIATRKYKYNEDLAREVKKINGQLIESNRVLSKKIIDLADARRQSKGIWGQIRVKQIEKDIASINNTIEALESDRYDKDRKSFNLTPLRVLGIQAGIPESDMSLFEYYFMTHREDQDTHINLQRYFDAINGRITLDHLDAITPTPQQTSIPKYTGIPKYSNIPKYMPRPNTEVMSEATKGMQPNKEFSNPRVKDVNQP